MSIFFFLITCSQMVHAFLIFSMKEKVPFVFFFQEKNIALEGKCTVSFFFFFFFSNKE